MNYQVLRGAIFAFVDELEARVLGIGTAISEGMSRLIETAFDAGLHLVEAVIEEGFNLFRASLTVVLGVPEEKGALPYSSVGFAGLGLYPMDIDETEKAMAKAGELDFKPPAGSETVNLTEEDN